MFEVKQSAGSRRTDIDWLRIFATYMLFVFHGAMIFNPAPFFHVRNDETSVAMMVLAGFISLWHMPLFFLLAGWSAFGSMAARGAAGFVKERWFRLFVPLVAGSATLGPVIKFFELRNGLDFNHLGLRVRPDLQESFRSVIPSGLETAPPFDESFLQFLPTFFSDPMRFTWSHLWFIAYLFVFSVALAPSFAYLVRSKTAAGTGSVARIYAPVLPLAAAQVFLRPHWPGIQNLYNDWANVAFYGTFFFMGFVLARFPAYESLLHREARRAAVVALSSMIVLVFAVAGVLKSVPVILAATAVAGWCSVVAVLGFANAKWTRENETFRYLRESAFPVYIFHQPALVLIGYVVIQSELGIGSKFLLTLAVAVPATIAFYHFLVRPSRLLRFLCGMKAVPVSRAGGNETLGKAATVSLALGVSLFGCAGLASAEEIFGRWWAEGGAAQVEIGPCEGRVCGRVMWLRSPYDENGCELRDVYNPEPALRDRPVHGLLILEGFERDPDDGVWRNGRIYDPGSGRTYRSEIRRRGDRLLVRGYVGIPLIGRTTKWFRVGSEANMCSAVG
jgi:uncharacterized protein (DUF2147 family)